MPRSITSKEGRLHFRSSLECDVYHIVNKLEVSNEDRPFKTVASIYEAIKRSNSSLSRQRKRPLEDAIDRVLQICVQEQERDGSDESEAEIKAFELSNAGKDPFSLNKEMTQMWHAEKGIRMPNYQSATKRRRLLGKVDGAVDRASVPETANDAPETLSSTRDLINQTKKQPRVGRFKLDRPQKCVPLGGYDSLYDELLHHCWGLLRCSRLYENNNWLPTSGILLCGPSGIGKKSLIRNLSFDLGAPLISLTGCFQDSERMEKSLSEAFEMAISVAPCMVIIERIDQYMARPGSSGHNEHHLRATHFFTQQLQRVQSLHGKEGSILAIATSSRMTEIDPSMLKLGLLEKCIQMRIPDEQARHEIWSVVTRDINLSQVDLMEIARMTHGYVGADVAAVTKLAAGSAAKRTKDLVRIREAIIELRVQKQQGSTEDDLRLEKQIRQDANQDSSEKSSIIMDDLKAAIKDFVPSLRREGFTVIPNITWNQVGALEAARRQLQMSIIGPIKTPDLYRKFGLRRPAGVLLWGPPGCGKTLIAQAVANEAQASFILINGPELLNKYVGESERAVRELFQRARSSTPCILFFDEIDSIVPPRSNSSSDSGARVVNALLTEMDGAQDRSGIYVIGTTNRPEMIDEAMLRPGRLSVQLLVDLPTPMERTDILRAIYRTNHEEASAQELECLETVALDQRCTGFSGADLSGLHTKAAEHALERWVTSGGGSQIILELDWEYALSNTHASVRYPATASRLKPMHR